MSVENLKKKLDNLEAMRVFKKKYINIKTFPLASKYLTGRVYGKYNHKLYEISDYRRKTHSFAESVALISVRKNFSDFEKFEQNLCKNVHFWNVYSSVAKKNDSVNLSRNKLNDLGIEIKYHINSLLNNL